MLAVKIRKQKKIVIIVIVVADVTKLGEKKLTIKIKSS